MKHIRLFLFCFLLSAGSLLAQRVDSLQVSYWYPAPAVFFKQKQVQKMKVTVETRDGKKTARKSTGEYLLFDTTGHISESYWIDQRKKVLVKASYRYDNLGLPILITKYKDKLTPEPSLHRCYDVYNRPYSEYVVEYGDSNVVRRWQYDARGRLAVEYGSVVPVAQDVYMAAGWTEYFYDTLGRLEKSIGHTSYRAPEYGDYADSSIATRRAAPPAWDSSDEPYIIDYSYDSTGVTVNYQSKYALSVSPVKYRFDAYGRVIHIDCPVSRQSVVHEQFDFTYGDDGLLESCKERTKENGEKITRIYTFEYLKKGEKSSKKSGPSAVPEQY